MARLLEMGKLEARCQKRVDLEEDDHLSHETWLELISEAYGEAFEIASLEGASRYFERAEDLTSDGTNVLEEPSDVLADIGLWYKPASGGQWQQLTRLQPHEITAWTGRTGTAQRFEHIDDEIRLYPTPPAGHVFEFRYRQQAPDLTGYASDVCVDLMCVAGEAFVIWATAAKVLPMNDDDWRFAVSERDRYAEKLHDWAIKQPTMAEPARAYVVDEGRAPRTPGDW